MDRAHLIIRQWRYDGRSPKEAQALPAAGSHPDRVGSGPNISDEVLDALCRALRLDPAELAHLHNLAPQRRLGGARIPKRGHQPEILRYHPPAGKRAERPAGCYTVRREWLRA